MSVINKTYICNLEREIFNFILDGKHDKVKRSTLLSDYIKGGLNIIDIDGYLSTLKIKWVSR